MHVACAGEFCVTSPGVGSQDTGSNTVLGVMEEVGFFVFRFLFFFGFETLTYEHIAS